VPSSAWAHGSVRKKPTFKALERTLEVPIRLVRLDEQPAALARVTEGSTPCVASETCLRSVL
jgi:hypothetical protein